MTCHFHTELVACGLPQDAIRHRRSVEVKAHASRVDALNENFRTVSSLDQVQEHLIEAEPVDDKQIGLLRNLLQSLNDFVGVLVFGKFLSQLHWTLTALAKQDLVGCDSLDQLRSVWCLITLRTVAGHIDTERPVELFGLEAGLLIEAI